MKTKTWHTPTPWRITHDPVANSENDCAYVRGVQIVGPRAAVACGDDAKFIVRAVNEYDKLIADKAALLEAANKIVSQLDKAIATPYMDVDVNSLRAAIAQAEGKL